MFALAPENGGAKATVMFGTGLLKASFTTTTRGWEKSEPGIVDWPLPETTAMLAGGALDGAVPRHLQSQTKHPPGIPRIDHVIAQTPARDFQDVDVLLDHPDDLRFHFRWWFHAAKQLLASRPRRLRAELELRFAPSISGCDGVGQALRLPPRTSYGVIEIGQDANLAGDSVPPGLRCSFALSVDVGLKEQHRALLRFSAGGTYPEAAATRRMCAASF